jgi:hypothetical protein
MTHTGITMIATYIATYNVPLVVLSIVIASIASYTALNLAGRITVAKERSHALVGWRRERYGSGYLVYALYRHAGLSIAHPDVL